MLAQRAEWEWVVVDDASSYTAGVDEIRRQLGDDPRLKLITHDANQGIVGRPPPRWPAPPAHSWRCSTTTTSYTPTPWRR
jgi:hypothetical protein